MLIVVEIIQFVRFGVLIQEFYLCNWEHLEYVWLESHTAVIPLVPLNRYSWASKIMQSLGCSIKFNLNMLVLLYQQTAPKPWQPRPRTCFCYVTKIFERTYVHTYVRTYVHTYIHTHACVHTYSYLCTDIHTCIYTYVRPSIHPSNYRYSIFLLVCL